jgi:hypothetical protein
MPQMGYDTKTDRLTDCQSQCDFDFGRTLLVLSLPRVSWTDLRPPAFVLNILIVNKTSIFCSEYLLFVVGIPALQAI